MTIEIRPYELRDQQPVIDLILGIQQGEFGLSITLEGQPDLLIVKDFYQRDSGNFWVATDDGKVIGTIGLIDAGQGLGALRKMFVDAAYRGSEFGVATQLLVTLLDWAREHGLTEVYLGTVDARQHFLQNRALILTPWPPLHFMAEGVNSPPQHVPLPSVRGCRDALRGVAW
jgi:GNAT superfamily N-acetyltransferase